MNTTLVVETATEPQPLPPLSLTTATTEDETPLILTTDLPAPHTGHIRILSLNRPAARNAISRALLAQLQAAITLALTPTPGRTTRALILASTDPRIFCAGADLKERRLFSPAETTAFLSALRHTLATLSSQTAIPTISALAGPALGGGFELALATHFRVMPAAPAATAYVALPETPQLGIIPGAGGTYRLAELVGRSKARDLVLTGRRVSGREALDLGIADRLANSPETVLDEALKLARDLCRGPPIAVSMALFALDEYGEKAEDEAYATVLQTEDRNEALRAFAEKREPVFVGR